MKPVQIVIVVLFGIGLFISIATLIGLNPPDVLLAEFRLRWLIQAVGMFMAAGSALVLLVRSVGAGGLKDVAPPIVPLLAGLLMIQVHWSLALALALVVVSIVVMEILVGWRDAG